MATGILRIQSFAARESAPMPGVSVTVTGDGFTTSRVTDDAGSTADIQIEAPDCSYSLDENNTTVRPYAICSLVAQKAGYQTVTIEGIQIFSGQVTLAPLEMIPSDLQVASADPVVIPPHPLFVGGGGSGPAPATEPRVLPAVVIPKSITVHLGTPASSAKNVTVSFRDYIANVASSEVYPTWAGQNKPTLPPLLKVPFNRYFLHSSLWILRPDHHPVHQQCRQLPCQLMNPRQGPDLLFSDCRAAL